MSSALPPLPSIPPLTNVPMGGGLPAALQLLLSSSGMGNMFQDMDKQFGASTDRVNQMIGGANQAGNQWMEAFNQPAPQSSKWGDFAANLAGNISQAIAPQMNGQAIAQQTIQGANANATQARLQRLSALRDNYDTMAKAAQDAGNTLEHTKMLVKAESTNKLVEELGANARAEKQRQATVEAARLAHQDANTQRLEIARENNRARVMSARIGAGMVWDGQGDPADSTAVWTSPKAVISQPEFQTKWNDFVKAGRGKTGEAVDPEHAMAINNDAKNFALSNLRQNEVTNPMAYIARIRALKAPAPVKAGGWVGVGARVMPALPIINMKDPNDRAMVLQNLIGHYFNGDQNAIAVALRRGGMSPKDLAELFDQPFADSTQVK